MIAINGSAGEGGGQILRTALALSLVTGKPFRLSRLRARRRRPGLRPQHLVCVGAAAEIGAAEVTGAKLGSLELCFIPSALRAGDYRFDIGTAGSTTLAAQCLLPALMLAEGASTLALRGGTHNPLAPPYEFLANAFLPILRRMGAQVHARLVTPGFYPRGAGLMTLAVERAARLQPVALADRGALLRRMATATVAGLPRHIAERELRLIGEVLGLQPAELEIRELSSALGPGNVVVIELQSEQVTEVFTGFGRRGVPAERVAAGAAQAAQRYLAAEVAVAEHLADQLLLPLALAGGGSLTTLAPSLHTTTNRDVIAQFLDTRIAMQSLAGATWRIAVADPQQGRLRPACPASASSGARQQG